MHFLSAVFLAQITFATLCNPVNYQFAGQKIEAPIQQSATKQLTVDNVPLTIEVSGSIEIIDGCTFRVKDFVLKSPDLDYAWYGGIPGSDNASRLSATKVLPSETPSAQDYIFITAAGAAVSYADFTQFRLFSVQSNNLIATVDIASSGTPNPTPSTRTQSSGSSPKTNSVITGSSTSVTGSKNNGVSSSGETALNLALALSGLAFL